MTTSNLNHPQFCFPYKRDGRHFDDKGCKGKTLEHLTTLSKGLDHETPTDYQFYLLCMPLHLAVPGKNLERISRSGNDTCQSFFGTTWMGINGFALRLTPIKDSERLSRFLLILALAY